MGEEAQGGSPLSGIPLPPGQLWACESLEELGRPWAGSLSPQDQSSVTVKRLIFTAFTACIGLDVFIEKKTKQKIEIKLT